MQSLSQVSFTLQEWLAITGVVQTVFILVYMFFRVKEWRQASVAFGYFLMLGLFFALQFSLKIGQAQDYIHLGLWLTWSFGPPLSALLVLQVTDPAHPLPKKSFFILGLVPLSALVATVFARVTGVCDGALMSCDRYLLLLYWLSAISGALAMLGIWYNREVFVPLKRMRGGHERYWLVLTLIVANTGAALLNFLFSTGAINQEQSDVLRATLGILFAYLVMTTLFRIYPLPLSMNTTARLLTQSLSKEEQEIATRIKGLLDVEKVYQEANYGRAELAREIEVSESVLSRIINIAFGKTVPQILGEYRVEDAKRLLRDPEIPVHIVAQESGFNSLASFNRIFRDLTGESPTSWREKELKQ